VDLLFELDWCEVAQRTVEPLMVVKISMNAMTARRTWAIVAQDWRCISSSLRVANQLSPTALSQHWPLRDRLCTP
jgi:hypothetical protein